MKLLTLLFPLLLSAQIPQNWRMPGSARMIGGPATAGSTAPTYVSSASGSSTLVGGSFTFPFSAITTASGDHVTAVLGSRSSTGAQYCDTISGVTGTAGAGTDTYSLVKLVSSTNAFGTCIVMFEAFGVHAGSGNYVITAQGTSASNSSMQYAAMVHHPGSLASADGTPCSFSSIVGTSFACGSSMSTSGSVALVVGAIFAWDDSTSPAATSPLVLRTNANSGGSGSIYLASFETATPAASYTPAFSSIGLGDGGTLAGSLDK